MRTKQPYYNFIDQMLSKDVPDNKTPETVTLKDCSPPISHSVISMMENLNREDVRHKTFSNWPHRFLDTRKLAQTGFYHIGPNDNVKCYFCTVEIGRWEPEDDEVTEHIRWSQNCPLMKRRPTTNVPLDASELERVLPAPTYDVCGPCGVVDVRHGSYAESSFSVPPAETAQRRPDHPEYAIESARLRSYEDWPKTMKQKPKELSDAGFFYLQTGDRVKCFSCGGGLRDWDENDVPWEQHAEHFSKCEYLKLMKGQEYIDAVLAEKQSQQEETNSDTSSSATSSDDQEESISSRTASTLNHEKLAFACKKATNSSSSIASDIASSAGGVADESSPEKKLCDSKLCKICYSCEYNTAFFPCGHVVACAKCASSVTKCPMCRKPFERVMRVYFS